MIRNANIADIAQLLELADRLQPQTPYADVPLDRPTFISTAGNCVNNAFGFAMVAERGSELTGMMLGVAQPLWFSKKRSATDFVTYAERPGDGYRMIKAFRDWAWAMPGVVEITLGQSSGIDIERTGRLYERLGFTRVGAIYTAIRPTVMEKAA